MIDHDIDQLTRAMAQGFIIPPGGGEPVPTKTGVRKASSATTGNSIAVDEAVLDPGDSGPTRHYHTNLDEAFYVLEGEVLLQIGDEVQRAAAGTFAFSPRGNVHAFRAAGSERARLLIMVPNPPPGGERYFEEMAQMPVDATAEAWAELNARYGLVIVGPPLEAVP